MRSPHPLISQFPTPASCKDTLQSLPRARTQGLLDIDFEIIISQRARETKNFHLAPGLRRWKAPQLLCQSQFRLHGPLRLCCVPRP